MPSASTPAALPVQPNHVAQLRQSRFAPFFWTQFLGAGNDNRLSAQDVLPAALQARVTSLIGD